MSLPFTRSPTLQENPSTYVPATVEGRIEAHFIALARDESRCDISPSQPPDICSPPAHHWCQGLFD